VSENRRDTRFAARIVAKVVRRGETVELLTNDVSFRGAFLRTDAPPALRQLVKVTFALPTGEIVGGHAMVVHVVPPAPGSNEVPGVGLQFWGPMEQGKPWERFINELRVKEKAGMPSARITDKVRRASERFKLAIDIELDGRTAVTRDVSETGMAVRTDSAMPVGMRVSVRVHTAAEEVSIDVIVRRRIDDKGFKGLGVEFVDLSPETRRALLDFLRRNAPREDAQFVAPGDPKLH
jgi:hypothetical protein